MRNLRLVSAIFFFLITLISLKSQTQDILPHGVSPAGADVAFTERWIPWSNPSVLARESALSFSLGYENRYFVPELSDEYLSFSFPAKFFNIGVAYNFFGYAHYHEMMASLSVARKLGIVSLGVEFDYFNMRVSHEDGYKHAFTAQVGLQVDVSKNCVLGFRMFNPCFSRVSVMEQIRKLPVLIEVGCQYTFLRRLDLLSQFGYMLNNGFHWAVGVEYRIMNQLLVRTGVRGSDYIIPTLGAGIRFARFGFDMVAEADFRVGISLLSNLFYKF